MSIRLPIPDSRGPRDAPTATAVEATVGPTVSGSRSTCSSMGDCSFLRHLELDPLLALVFNHF